MTFVLSHDGLSGVARVVAAYASRWRAKGHDVAVVSFVSAKPTGSTVAGRLVSWMGGNKRSQLSTAAGVSHFDNIDVTKISLPAVDAAAAVGVPDADVVIATSWEAAEAVARWPKEKGRAVFFVHNHEYHAATPIDRVEAAWRLPMPKIVTTKWLADLARHRFNSRNVTIVPNAVDTDLFHTPPRTKQQIPTVGMLFSNDPLKGCDISLNAYATASQAVKGLKLIAFGTTAPAKGKSLPAELEFHQQPSQEQIRDIYARCDAWMFASRTEGFGLPILEAMACRTPVLATPAGAAPELLAGGGGLLVHPEHPKSLADAIVQVARSTDEQWQTMSTQALNVATRYTWDDAMKRFEGAIGV